MVKLTKSVIAYIEANKSYQSFKKFIRYCRTDAAKQLHA